MDFEEDLHEAYPENNSPGKEEEFLFEDEAGEDVDGDGDQDIIGDDSDGGQDNDDDNENDEDEGDGDLDGDGEGDGDGDGEGEGDNDDGEGVEDDEDDDEDGEGDGDLEGDNDGDLDLDLEGDEDGDGDGDGEGENDGDGGSDDGSDDNDPDDGVNSSDDDADEDEEDESMDIDKLPSPQKSRGTPEEKKEDGVKAISPSLSSGSTSISSRPKSEPRRDGPAQATPTPRRSPSPPPSLKRQRLFYPSLTLPTPKSLHIDPIATIPIHSPVHSLSSSLCFSHLLTGSEDGFVRNWDPWASANGGSIMTAQQRAVGGLGESVTKGGVARGWWANEGGKVRQGGLDLSVKDQTSGNGLGFGPKGAEGKKREPVYSLACQKDALWGLSGTVNGNINLYTIRHAMGQIQHVLQNGHKDAVSGLTLNDTDDILYSASWDGSVAEWDLNTGRKIRSFPTQGVQLSSISLQPLPGGPNDVQHRENNTSYRAFASKLDESDINGSNTHTQDELADGNRGMNGLNGPNKPSASVLNTNGNSEGLNPKERRNPPKNASDLDAEGEDEDAQGEIEDDLFGDEFMGEVIPQPQTQPSATATTAKPSTTVPSLSLDSSAPIETKPDNKPAINLALPGSNTGSNTTNNSMTNGSSFASKPTDAAPDSPSSLFSSSNVPTFMTSTTVTAPPPTSRFIPSLSSTAFSAYSSDVMMTSSIDGNVTLWDRRVPGREMGSRGVGRLEGGEKTPKWCMSACFSATGSQVYAGRRNGTVEVWDIRRTASNSTSTSLSASHVMKTLRNPSDSGAVSCVVAFPDGGHIACASNDNIRLWPTSNLFESQPNPRSSGVPFKIVPGHHGGIISSMVVDSTSQFLVTASGNRGWVGQGESTNVVIMHSIKKTYV